MKISKNLVVNFGILAALSQSLAAYDNGLDYSFALVGMNMDYTEYDNQGAFADSEKSHSIGGFEMRYDYKFGCDENECSEWSLDAMMSGGYSDYNGYDLITGTPKTGTTTNTIYDIDMNYKHHYMYNSIDFIFGLGVGYHLWDRELSTVQDEVYSWFNITPIIGANFEVIHDISMGVLTKYKYGIHPTLSANNLTKDLDLGRADIIEVTIPLRYKYSNSLDFFTELTFTKQMIDRSNIGDGYVNGVLRHDIYEPDSTAYNNFIKIGATLKY